MDTIPEHLRRYEIAERVTLVKGGGDLPKISVKTDWSTAEIYLLGAHVTGFQKYGEPPLLFMSEASQFAVGKPIRGGVPIVFPWFGPREGRAPHGFARVTEWEWEETLSRRIAALHFDSGSRIVPRAPMARRRQR